MLTGAIQQFFREVAWRISITDSSTCPRHGDVALSMSQTVPVVGSIV
jgi:hypothetical protein